MVKAYQPLEHDYALDRDCKTPSCQRLEQLHRFSSDAQVIKTFGV
jgi:hypothetical protein